MNAQTLVKKLTAKYDDRVKVRSQYHIQIESDKGPNDVWINKSGYIKFKRVGDRNVYEGLGLDAIYKHLDRTDSTHIEKMQEMLDATKSIDNAQNAAKRIGDGIFTDAGWKDGTAKTAAIMISCDDIDAKIRVFEDVEDINKAEFYAIELGRAMDRELMVYNDNKGVCAVHTDERVKWLSRRHTIAADKLGNMRNK